MPSHNFITGAGRALDRAALHAGDPAWVSLVLDAGADVNIRSALNYSKLLHMGVAFNQGPKVAEILLDRGAVIGTVNGDGLTPCQVGMEREAGAEMEGCSACRLRGLNPSGQQTSAPRPGSP